MKYYCTAIVLLLLLQPLKAQDTTPPAKEFIVRAKTSKVEVSRGGQSNVEMEILRSRSYQRPEATLSLGSSVPAGITVTYDPEKGVVDRSTVSIQVSAQAAPGDYNILMNCTVKNKTKGVILKLKVL